MPRNTNDKEYITVAIRKDSCLMRQLDIDAREKSQPKSHLLVSYAADYVRLFLISNGVPSISAPTSQILPVEPSVKEEDPLITSNLTDDDLDIYSD
jgi:hypothetical protein